MIEKKLPVFREIVREYRKERAEFSSEISDARRHEFENVEIKATENGHALRRDDLKIVEGIGPKIEELLHEAGIFTFDELAATEPSRIRKILNAAGPRFKMHDPETWPAQAAMAAAGKWDELMDWQEKLKSGKEVAELV